MKREFWVGEKVEGEFQLNWLDRIFIEIGLEEGDDIRLELWDKDATY